MIYWKNMNNRFLKFYIKLCNWESWNFEWYEKDFWYLRILFWRLVKFVYLGFVNWEEINLFCKYYYGSVILVLVWDNK